MGVGLGFSSVLLIRFVYSFVLLYSKADLNKNNALPVSEKGDATFLKGYELVSVVFGNLLPLVDTIPMVVDPLMPTETEPMLCCLGLMA